MPVALLSLGTNLSQSGATTIPLKVLLTNQAVTEHGHKDMWSDKSFLDSAAVYSFLRRKPNVLEGFIPVFFLSLNTNAMKGRCNKQASD